MRIDDLYRVEKYSKDSHQEKRLRLLNLQLAPLEEQLIRRFDTPKRPTIFILGAPRSGSTLLSQVLAASGGLGYVDNFVARFWMAPYLGTQIEAALNVCKQGSGIGFTSVFGVTEGWAGPHEFGYFWERWFVFRDTHKVAPEDLETVDGRTIQREVAALEAAYNRPFFFKTLVCGLQLSLIAELFPQALFLVIRRDPAFNAQSLLRAREERLGSKEHWYSMRPREYQNLKGLSCYEQVAAQIHCIFADVESQLNHVSADRCLELHYEDICVRPRAELERVMRFVRNHGETVEYDLGRLPNEFRCANVQRLDDWEWSLLQAAVEQYAGKTAIP